MPLQSKLFQDDPALQACLVRDNAHVLKGARGAHVEKIQRALLILEGALIDVDELTASVYGPSTASAVLAYKKKRDIVNRSYQQRADDIVGKMTIASLDRELFIGEQKRVTRSCREPLSGPASITRRSSLIERSGVGDPPQKQFPAIMSVLFQVARVKRNDDRQSFAIIAGTLKKANELVAPFGQRIAMIPGFSIAVNFKLKVGEAEEFRGLRKAAEAAMPGFGKAIRVILCPFRANDAQDDDLKTNAVSMSIEGFDRFIVINSNLLRADRGTLLHEMIHCSRDSLMGEVGVHDPDGSGGIFSWDANRTKLFPDRAEALRGAFFSFAR